MEGVKGALKYGVIDVIHPLINFSGLGILHGTREDMERQLLLAKQSGRGIFAMKVLGGGNLLRDYDMGIQYARELDCVDAVAIGMQSRDEIDGNIQYFEEGRVGDDLKAKLLKVNRQLLIEDHCTGCGKCVQRCSYKALRIADGRAAVNRDCCMTCGYCAGVCPDFCIKIV